MSNPQPLIYLPFQSVKDNTYFPDESGNSHSAFINGTVELIPSDQLGADASFSGIPDEGDYLSVPDPEGELDFNFDDDNFTIEFWVQPSNPQPDTSGQTILIKGSEAMKENAPDPYPYAVSYNSSDNTLTFSRRDPSGSIISLTSSTLAEGKLQQIAIVRSGGDVDPKILTFYIDGEKDTTGEDTSSNDGYTSNDSNLTIGSDWAPSVNGTGGADNYFSGQIGSFRIYNLALSIKQIQSDRFLDLSSLSAYRQSHPFDIHFATQDQQNVFYLNVGTDGQTSSLEVRNTSGQTVVFNALSEQPTVSAHHFALWFRPGVIQLGADLQATSPDWRMSNANFQVNGSVVYYLRSVKEILLEPGALLNIELSGITIDTTGGTRETSTEVGYNNLAYVAEPSSLIIGSRLLTIALINKMQQGDSDSDGGLPLALTWATDNQIVTDGVVENELHLVIRNVGQDTIVFNPNTSETQSQLVLKFDVGPQRGTIGVIREGITVTLDGWDAPYGGIEQGTDDFSVWPFAPTSEVQLEPDQTIGPIRIKNLVAESPSGQTNVYIKTINVPNEPDSQFITHLMRSPLRYKVDQGVSVKSTTGTLELYSPLLLHDGLKTNALESTGSLSAPYMGINADPTPNFLLTIGKTLSGITFDTDNQLLNLTTTEPLILSTDSIERVRIKKDGNVGINTSDPKIPLALGSSNMGFGYSDATLRFYPGSTTPKMLLTSSGKLGVNTASDPSVRIAVSDSGTGLDYRTSNQIKYLRLYVDGSEQMSLNSNGHVGIGTNSSALTLALGESNTGLDYVSSHKLKFYTYGRERMTIDNSGNVTFGTDSSSSKLQIKGSSPKLKIGDWEFSISGNKLRLVNSRYSTHKFEFDASNGKFTDSGKRILRDEDPIYIMNSHRPSYLNGTTTSPTVREPSHFKMDTYWRSQSDPDSNLTIHYLPTPFT